jgi:hypothetical protein
MKNPLHSGIDQHDEHASILSNFDDIHSTDFLRQLVEEDHPEGVWEVTGRCLACGNSFQLSATLALEIVEGRIPGPFCLEHAPQTNIKTL